MNMARTKQTARKSTKNKTPTPPSKVGSPCVNDNVDTPVVNDKSLPPLPSTNGGYTAGNAGSGKRKAADDTASTLISHEELQLFRNGLHGNGDGLDPNLLRRMEGDEIADLLTKRGVDFIPPCTKEELLNMLNRYRFPIPPSIFSRFRIVQLPKGVFNFCAKIQGSPGLLVITSVSDSYTGEPISVGEAVISFDYVPLTSDMTTDFANRLCNRQELVSLTSPAVIGVLSPVSLSTVGGSRKKGKRTPKSEEEEEIAKVPKPKKPLNRYNLFYRYKKKLIEEHLKRNLGVNKDDVLAIINAVVGTEGVQGTDSMSPEELDQIRSSNIHSLLENDLQPHDTSKRVHKASEKSVLSFVELGKAIAASWKSADEFAKGVFTKLAEKGKEASGYTKKSEAYQNKVKEIKARFAENEKKKQEAPTSSKPNTPKVNQAAADSQVISPDVPVDTTTTKEVSSFSTASAAAAEVFSIATAAAAKKTEPAKKDETDEEKEPAKDKETVEEEDFPIEGDTVQKADSVMVVLLKSANQRLDKVNDKVTTLEENAKDVSTQQAYANSKLAIAKAKTILNKFGNNAVEMERTLKEEKAAEETEAKTQSLSEIQSLKTKLTQSESSLTKANERNEVLETEKAGLAEENFLLVEENESLNAKIDALKAENESLKQHEKEASFSDSEEEKCDGYHEVRAKMGN